MKSTGSSKLLLEQRDRCITMRLTDLRTKKTTQKVVTLLIKMGNLHIGAAKL
jgi:hypothetical protein